MRGIVGIRDDGAALRDSCPVSELFLQKLMRSNEDSTSELVGSLRERDKARLSLFLYSRRHMRELGLKIAAQCSEQVLVSIAGPAGAVVFAQSRELLSNEVVDQGRPVSKVSLAKAA